MLVFKRGRVPFGAVIQNGIQGVRVVREIDFGDGQNPGGGIAEKGQIEFSSGNIFLDNQQTKAF